MCDGLMVIIGGPSGGERGLGFRQLKNNRNFSLNLMFLRNFLLSGSTLASQTFNGAPMRVMLGNNITIFNIMSSILT